MTSVSWCSIGSGSLSSSGDLHSSTSPDTTVRDFDFELPEEPVVVWDELVAVDETTVPPETTVADFVVELGALCDDENPVPDDPMDFEALMAVGVIAPVPGICLATTNPKAAAAPVARMAKDLDVQRTLAIAS